MWAGTEIFDSAFSRWIFCNIGRQWQCFISNHATRVKLSPLSCLVYMPWMPSYVSVVHLKKLRKSELRELRKNILTQTFFTFTYTFILMACRGNRQATLLLACVIVALCSLISPFVSLVHQKYLITSHSLYFTDVHMYLR